MFPGPRRSRGTSNYDQKRSRRRWKQDPNHLTFPHLPLHLLLSQSITYQCATGKEKKKKIPHPHHSRASIISSDFPLAKFRPSVLPFDDTPSRDQPHYLPTATRSPALVWQWVYSFLTGSLYNWIWCLQGSPDRSNHTGQGARVALRITWRTGQTIKSSLEYTFFIQRQCSFDHRIHQFFDLHLYAVTWTLTIQHSKRFIHTFHCLSGLLIPAFFFLKKISRAFSVIWTDKICFPTLFFGCDWWYTNFTSSHEFFFPSIIPLLLTVHGGGASKSGS